MTRFALIDGNNFFVSCQRVFQPNLEGQPVVTLSNNDGCVIAMSNEAKVLGISMAQPAFKIRKILEQNNVVIFSGNLELYCDMSERMMTILRHYAPQIEKYSIDEAFLDMSAFHEDELDDIGRQIKADIWQKIGIPVCVGFGHTKTLAKVANRFAKKTPELQGVYSYDVMRSPASLGLLDIEDVWGVGRSYARFLKGCGVKTAYDFREANPAFIRKTMGVVGARIQRELKGISCIPLQTEAQPKKSLAVTRSLHRPTKSYQDVRESVATRLVRACEKLRNYRLAACELTIFITTTKFTASKPYKGVVTHKFQEPTSQTHICLQAALKMFDHIFKDGYEYKKSGVIFSQLVPEQSAMRDLFFDGYPDYTLVLSAIDDVNQRYGRHSLQFGATGLKRPWQPIPSQCSPRYTTRFDEILVV